MSKIVFKIYKVKIKQIIKILSYLNETQKLNWSFRLRFSVRHACNQKKKASKKKEDLIAKHVANRF